MPRFSKTAFILAVGIGLVMGPLAGAKVAAADEDTSSAGVFSSMEPMNSDELATTSGGESPEFLTFMSQNNETDIDSEINDSPIINKNATMSNGGIGSAEVTASRGVVSVMQNTGNLVNMSNSMSVNVYFY